jgi:hypothetical protein
VHDGTDAPNAREKREVMAIPIDGIVIPERFVALCSRWYGGQGCMLYAVSSTGGLTIGTIRPPGCCTNEQWYYSIWRDLSVDVMYARRAAESTCNDYDPRYDGHFDFEELQSDCAELREFEEWVDARCDDLCADYDLDDWEPCA